MMRLIDADKLIEKLSAGLDNPEELPVISVGTVMRMIDREAEIVRCKDCKHYHTDVFGQELGIEGLYGNLIVAHNACDKWSEHMNSVDPDGFCFLAERRTDAAE